MNLSPQKLNLKEMNGGHQYTNGQTLSAKTLNDIIQSAAFSQALTENKPLILIDETKPSPYIEFVTTENGTPQIVFYNIVGTDLAAKIEKLEEFFNTADGEILNESLDTLVEIQKELAELENEQVWDLVITEDMLTDTNINTILSTAKGRVFVKALGNLADNVDEYGRITINVPSAIKLIEFAPRVVFETEVNIVGSDDTDTYYLDDCQVIRGASNRGISPSFASINWNTYDCDFTKATPKIKNFKGGVEHCHGEGWFIEDCNNIEHCTILGINNCQQISHCNVTKDGGDFHHPLIIANSTNIEDLVAIELTMSGWYFVNCKYIRDVVTDGNMELYNCSYISNIVHTPVDSGYVYGNVSYTNCTFVDPYTCADFLKVEDIGKVQALTIDGSFVTIPSAEGVSF